MSLRCPGPVARNLKPTAHLRLGQVPQLVTTRGYGLGDAETCRASARGPTWSARRGTELDELVAQREDERLELGVHAQLAQDVGDVIALGADRDVQP